MRTAPKRRNRSITKSCGDAKLELFSGARPPDTTFTSWYIPNISNTFLIFVLPLQGQALVQKMYKTKKISAPVDEQYRLTQINID